MIAGFLTRDLMFLAKVQSKAAMRGWSLHAASDVPKLVGKISDAAQVARVFIDLGLPALNIEQVATELLEAFPNAVRIGYGAHVRVEELNAARQAGIEHVYTRGQFDSAMDRWFQGASEST